MGEPGQPPTGSPPRTSPPAGSGAGERPPYYRWHDEDYDATRHDTPKFGATRPDGWGQSRGQLAKQAADAANPYYPHADPKEASLTPKVHKHDDYLVSKFNALAEKPPDFVSGQSVHPPTLADELPAGQHHGQYENYSQLTPRYHGAGNNQVNPEFRPAYLETLDGTNWCTVGEKEYTMPEYWKQNRAGVTRMTALNVIPGTVPRVAVLGAGLAAGWCTAALMRGQVKKGYGIRPRVHVFERGPVAGGRCRTATILGQKVDLGAHSISVHESDDEAWERAVYHLTTERGGPCEEWKDYKRGSINAETGRHSQVVRTRQWRVPNGMQALGEHLLEGAQVRYDTNVEMVKWDGSAWILQDDQGNEEVYDWLVATSPAVVQPGGCLRDTLEFAGADGFESNRGVRRMRPMLGTLANVRYTPALTFAMAWPEDDEKARSALASLPYDEVDISGCKVIARIVRQGPTKMVVHAHQQYAAEQLPHSRIRKNAYRGLDDLNNESADWESEQSNLNYLPALASDSRLEDQQQFKLAREMGMATAKAFRSCGIRLPSPQNGPTEEERGWRLGLFPEGYSEAMYRVNSTVSDCRLSVIGDFIPKPVTLPYNTQSARRCALLCSYASQGTLENAAMSGLRAGHDILRMTVSLKNRSKHGALLPDELGPWTYMKQRAYCAT